MWFATSSSRWFVIAEPASEPAEQALIALGSNLGEPRRQLGRALAALADLGTITRRSALYRSEAVGGPPGQPDYLNAVVDLLPHAAWRSPTALLEALLAIERRQGRRRRIRWDARTLDLDLLAVGVRVEESETLTLPHPRMMTRPFVLAPLCEIRPDWRHPRSGVSACQALERVLATGAAGAERTDLGWT